MFSIPFAGAGLLCWFGALLFCFQMARQPAWEKIGARIIEAPGDGRLEDLVYEYSWQGRAYAGNGRDGVTKFFRASQDERQLERDIANATANRTPIPVWVNPRQPEQSYVLPPRLSLLPLFLGLFVLSHGGAGFGILGGALNAARQARQRADLESRYPLEPWKWRDDWVHGRADGARTWWRWLMVWFVVGWGSIALPLALIVLAAPDSGPGLRLGALAGAAFTALPAWLCVYAFRRHRLSRAIFIALPDTGLRTGQIHTVEVSRRDSSPLPRQEEPRTWTLKCLERVTTRSGGESSTATLEHWKDSAEVLDQGWREQLRFSIPAGAPETSAWSGENGITWELRGKRPGEPELGPFVLPVFGESAPAEEAGIFPFPETEKPVEPAARESAFAAEGMLQEEAGRFRFPPGRHAQAARVALIVGGGLVLVGVVPWLIPGVPLGLRLVLLVFLATGALFVREGLRQLWGDQVIEVEPGGLRLSRTLFHRQTVSYWSREAIQALRVQPAWSYNGVQFYTIQLQLSKGPPKTITPLFRHRATAEAFRELLTGLIRPG